jgi:hypothetical protein
LAENTAVLTAPVGSNDPAVIVVRPRHQWMRDRLSGHKFGAIDGNEYQCELGGLAILPANVQQHTHPDWELVSGTPITAQQGLSGEPIPPSPLIWVKATPTFLRGRQITGPAPVNYVAFIDADGRAAVPANAGFAQHPDFSVGELLTDEEAEADAAMRARLMPAAVAAPFVDRRLQDIQEAEQVKRLADQIQQGLRVQPTIGSMGAGLADPNATGVAGVLPPDRIPPIDVNPGAGLPIPSGAPGAGPPPAPPAELPRAPGTGTAVVADDAPLLPPPVVLTQQELSGDVADLAAMTPQESAAEIAGRAATAPDSPPQAPIGQPAAAQGASAAVAAQSPPGTEEVVVARPARPGTQARRLSARDAASKAAEE